MNTTELYDAFRSDIVDTAQPYLWSDEEVWRYMADAQRMFVRLIGGIADFDSEATTLDVVTGEAVFDCHPSVLRIMQATLASDNSEVMVINSTDLGRVTFSDYGRIRQLGQANLPGPVRYMMIGANKKSGKWVQVPEADDTVNLMIYRTPLKIVSGDDEEIYEIAEEHHLHLLEWMKYLAYNKADADTFNPTGSRVAKENFEAYTRFVKAEDERFKHKTRVVTYGGL